MTLHGVIGRRKEIITVKLLTQGLAHSKGLASDTHVSLLLSIPSHPEEMLFHLHSQFKCQFLSEAFPIHLPHPRQCE